MHPAALSALAGIEACRRYLARHPGVPAAAVCAPFDFADATAVVRGAHGRAPARRFVQLRPGSDGIALGLACGPLLRPGPALHYPTLTAPGDLRVDLEAIVAAPFQALLENAAGRALARLASLPETADG